MNDSTAVFWFRRDLRLADNLALAAALEDADRVVPVFIWDPALVAPGGDARLRFLAGCLDEISAESDGRLVQRSGDPGEELSALVEAVGAEKVYATADFGPYGSLRDERVKSALGDRGVRLELIDSSYAVAPGTLFTAAGDPYQVFSPFHRAWQSHGWTEPLERPALDRLSRADCDDASAANIPAVEARLPVPGEGAAHETLERFLEGPALVYGKDRNRPDLDSTSRLSPYLRFGCIHPRQILSRLEPNRSSHDRFAAELCWREFYADVLWQRPDAARRSYREEWRSFSVDTGTEADRRFAAWTEGRTGYPIVDAGMRQLLGEAWMHNRVRMIVASFLVKDLHVDWGRGARWFMEHLVDGDLASNQLNWQWVAGSGTDAAPYFRIFNPVSQGRKFDPDGEYIRRWVPELRSLPADVIHEPWKEADSLLATDYPPPIVDHATERQEALARYSQLRGNRSGPLGGGSANSGRRTGRSA